MKIEIDRGDGQVDTLDLDLNLPRLMKSTRVQSRLKQALGAEVYRDFMGGVDPEPDPDVLLALIWAALVKTPYRDIPLEAIDFDVSELATFAETDEEKAWVGEVVSIPMETDTGTVAAEVTFGE